MDMDMISIDGISDEKRCFLSTNRGMILVVRIGKSHAGYGMTRNKVCMFRSAGSYSIVSIVGKQKILRQLVTIGNYETLQRIE